MKEILLSAGYSEEDMLFYLENHFNNSREGIDGSEVLYDLFKSRGVIEE